MRCTICARCALRLNDLCASGSSSALCWQSLSRDLADAPLHCGTVLYYKLQSVMSCTHAFSSHASSQCQKKISKMDVRCQMAITRKSAYYNTVLQHSLLRAHARRKQAKNGKGSSSSHCPLGPARMGCMKISNLILTRAVVCSQGTPHNLYSPSRPALCCAAASEDDLCSGGEAPGRAGYHREGEEPQGA